MSTPSWPSLYNPGIDLIDIPHNAPVQPGGAYLTHPVDIFRFTLFWTLIFYCPAFIFCGFYAFWNINFPPAPRPHNVRGTPESSRSPKHGKRSEEEVPFWPPSNSGAYPLSPLKPASAKPEPPPPPKPPPPRQPKAQAPSALPSTSSSFPTAPTFRSTTPFLPRTDDPSLHASPSPGQTSDPSNTSDPSDPSGSTPSPPSAPPTKKPKYQYKKRERRSRFTFALLVLLTFLAAGLAGAVLGSAIVGFVAAAFFRSAHYHMSTWIPFLLAVILVLMGYLSLWPSVIDII